MINETFAKELEEELARELPGTKAPLKVAPAPQAIKPNPSLSEQWAMLEKIDRELRTRIRRERADMIAAYDRDVATTVSDFDIRIEETVADLNEKKRMALRALAEETAKKLREHDMLQARLER